MVIKQYISQMELENASPEGRDRLLKNHFGVSDEDLRNVRSKEDIYENLISSAKLIYDVTNDPIAVTIDNIAAVGSHDWNKRTAMYRYSQRLTSIYNKERKKIYAEKHIRTPTTHFLRKEIGAYFGNLEETAPLWEVQPSTADWLRSVKLPETLELNSEASQLLGIIWADGCITNKRTGHKLRGVHISLRKDDVNFYNDYLVSRIKKVFNINSNTYISKKSPYSKEIDGNIVSFKECTNGTLTFSSGAICDMLSNLNFPISEKRKNIHLPYFSSCDEYKRNSFSYNALGFFEGLIAGRGQKAFSSENQNHSIRIAGGNEKFIKEIDSLATFLGLSTSGVKTTNRDIEEYYTRIGQFGERKITDVNLINPSHKELFK